MPNPIIIFEQDCIDFDRSGAKLTEAYCRENFKHWVEEGDEFESIDEIPIIPEYEDETIVVFQVLNREGESWKLMQVK